ncbi:hypothetical protein [Photobacterium sanguinicancri]|uniref:hypothetical protein n=1 Tax=Photobacterium sanguinicancri TaxID=875932 RepID=UPI001F14C1ED|nr:hypothetical protein [Photobacterium sanguinicancri]
MSWLQTSFAQTQLALLNDKLEQLVIERTRNLMETNQELRDTINQYELSQAELKQAHSELVQAAKLAMLGELSASINHEINQPLAPCVPMQKTLASYWSKSVTTQSPVILKKSLVLIK